MRLKGLAIATAICATAFGGVATADAKPVKKLKDCKQQGKKLRCETTDGDTVTGVCPTGYEPVQTIQVGPGSELLDMNGNLILCYSASLGVIDDTPSR
ncbi:MAG TPA: hypothetical protein VF545_00460 [Thermoleophilaceae bacterium]|jgi:hypothetical protein